MIDWQGINFSIRLGNQDYWVEIGIGFFDWYWPNTYSVQGIYIFYLGPLWLEVSF